MEPSSPRAAAPVEDVLVDLPLHSIVSRGHRMTIGAQIQQSRMIPAPISPPRLSIYFSLRTIPPPDEQANFTFNRSFGLFMNKQAWEREARAILAHVTANHMEPDNLDFFTRAFCRYTSFAFLHMTDLVSIELSSVIIVHTNSSAISGLLNISNDDDDYDDVDDDDSEDDDDDDDSEENDDDDDDSEENDDDDGDSEENDDNYDDDDDADSGIVLRPASAAAVEGLKMVTAEESDSCFICLEGFGMSAPALVMPCSHLFHESCLKKWLKKNCSCPLCRFSLPEDSSSSTD